eukprot:COSAG06_NODE_2881_length_6137_cov_2.388972_4_plen_52_part_00
MDRSKGVLRPTHIHSVNAAIGTFGATDEAEAQDARPRTATATWLSIPRDGA